MDGGGSLHRRCLLPRRKPLFCTSLLAARLPSLHASLPHTLHVSLWPWHVRAGGGKDCLAAAAAADVYPLSLSICPTLPSQADLCSPSDLLQGTSQGLWTTLEAVKRAEGRAPPPLWPPSGLGGFILFYVVLMLLLYVVCTRFLGS